MARNARGMPLSRFIPSLAKILRLVLIGAAVLAAGWGLTVLGEPALLVGPARVELRRATVQDRQETLVRLRAAWSLRPGLVNPEVEKEEVRFINRVGAFARNLRGTEAFDDACQLYAACMRDHLQRYGR
jgi:hypothetical protein